MKIKAVIYPRISKEDQSVYSLSAQIEECKKYIENEGYELVDVYIEDGASSKNMNRPQLQAMLKDMQQKKFNMIVIWRLDRLTRNTLDGLNMVINMFKPIGVEFASVTEDIDTSTPDGMMMFTIRLSMAQNEREKIAERVKLGQRARAKEGKRNSSARPYGFQVGEDLQLTIDETESVVVKRMYELYLRGNGWNKIATILNSEGILSPRDSIWRERNVAGIVRNPTNMGAVHWKLRSESDENRVVVRNTHPAIISEDIYNQAMEISRRKRENTMSQSSYAFPFSTVVKCGKCGRSYHGKMDMRGVRSYRCSGKYRQDRCRGKDISEKKLANLFLSFIRNVHIVTDNQQETIGTKDAEKEIKRLEKQIKDSSNRRKQYTRAMSDGKLPYEEYSEMVDEENRKTSAWQKELDALSLEKPQNKRTHQDTIRMIQHLDKEWPLLSDELRKINVQNLFSYIVIKKINDQWQVLGYKLDN